MKTHSCLGRFEISAIITSLLLLTSDCLQTRASQAYGTLNNFDCVNDTGFEAHGFDIELDDLHSTDITYTYDWNHYGIPKISEDKTDPLHPKVLVRYAAVKKADGTWSAYTAIPSGPISPTQGHQFTNPSVNFGGEHFGMGYYGAPTAVRYFWLIDDGTGNLVHGAPVYVSTPTFTYNPPPAPALPAIIIPEVIPPPPPPEILVLEFGQASWVKDIKTTTHNPNKVKLDDLVADDEGQPQPWANGEPAEVETEWRLLQTEFADAQGGKNGKLEGGEQEVDGDDVVTRRYEFYKYIGPIDAESGEAVADKVGELDPDDPDGVHYFGVGEVTYNDHFDAVTGEWVEATVDLSTVWVVGEFFGAQMSGFDALPELGLIDHLQDGEIYTPYVERTVVVGGNPPYLAAITSGALPTGMSLDEVTGVLSGTPQEAGVFTFTVSGIDLSNANISKTYDLNIANIPITIDTTASPLAGGATSGGGVANVGDSVTVLATANAGYAFVNWTEGPAVVSVTASYTFTAAADRTLVAHFIPRYTIGTSSSPLAGGTTTGGGTFDSGANVTVLATPNAGYAFVNWTEGPNVVSTTASYTFNASADRTLVARFIPRYTINTSSSPLSGGTTSGGGTFNSGANVTILATPNAGYAFVNWTEGPNVVSAAASYTFTANANRELAAHFTLTGDLDNNNCVDRNDLNILMEAIRVKSTNLAFDFNHDGLVNIADARKLALMFSRPGGAPCN